MVYTGFMTANDDKLPIQQTFTKKGDATYKSALIVTGIDGKPVEWEEETCRKAGK
jgi:hypothetical protein